MCGTVVAPVKNDPWRVAVKFRMDLLTHAAPDGN